MSRGESKLWEVGDLVGDIRESGEEAGMNEADGQVPWGFKDSNGTHLEHDEGETSWRRYQGSSCL